MKEEEILEAISEKQGHIGGGGLYEVDAVSPAKLAAFLAEHLETTGGCPPHNMQPYTFTGSWSATIPPPTQRCAKCLITL